MPETGAIDPLETHHVNTAEENAQGLESEFPAHPAEKDYYEYQYDDTLYNEAWIESLPAEYSPYYELEPEEGGFLSYFTSTPRGWRRRESSPQWSSAGERWADHPLAPIGTIPEEAVEKLDSHYGALMQAWLSEFNKENKADFFMMLNQEWLGTKIGVPLEVLKFWGHEPGLTREMAREKNWTDLGYKLKFYAYVLATIWQSTKKEGWAPTDDGFVKFEPGGQYAQIFRRMQTEVENVAYSHLDESGWASPDTR